MAKFEKGHKKLGGREKGKLEFATEFIETLRTVEKETGKSLLRHAVNEAMTDNTVLIAVLKKILPDMTQTDFGKNAQEVAKLFLLPRNKMAEVGNGETDGDTLESESGETDGRPGTGS